MKNLCMPLLSLDETRNQLWICFATATFTNVGDSFFLVTPAHSFDGLHGKPLYIPVSPEPISLENHVFLSDQKMDVAAIKLGNEIIDRLAEEIIFLTSEILDNFILSQIIREFSMGDFWWDHTTVVSGFPSNRNKLKTRNHRVGTHGLNIETFDIPPDIYKQKGLRLIYEHCSRLR